MRGGNDDAVGGVSVEIGQGVGADADVAVHGDLDQTLAEQFPSPGCHITRRIQPVLGTEHRHFPKSEGRNCRIIVPPSQF